MNNFRLKRQFSVVGHSENHVELRSGIWNPISYTVTDDSEKSKLYSLVNDLDGSYSASELAKKHKISRAEVEGLIDHLQQLRVLETSPQNALDAYIDSVHLSYHRDINKEKSILQTIQLIGDQDLTSMMHDEIHENIDDVEIEVMQEDNPLYSILNSKDVDWWDDEIKLMQYAEEFQDYLSGFPVILQKTIDPVFLNSFNKIAYRLKKPWLHSVIDGPFLFVGPTFIPNQGPCYECFEKRGMMNLRELTSYQSYKKALLENNVKVQYERGLLPAVKKLLLSHTLMEIVHYISTNTGFTNGKVFSIYLPTMEINFNEVLRVASCRTCGSSWQRDNKQIYFDFHTLLEGSV